MTVEMKDWWNFAALRFYYWKWHILWCHIGMSIWFAHHVHSLSGQFAKPVNIEICSIKYSGLLFQNISNMLQDQWNIYNFTAYI